MLLLSLFSLLDIRRVPSVKGVKLLSNHLSRGANSTFILKPRATNGVSCPADLSDTDTCSTVQGGVAAAIRSANDDEGIEAAINSYLAACPASQCQQNCVILITAEGKTVAVASKDDLATSFGTDCPLPPAANTQTITCPGTGIDTATCTSLYDDVLTEVDTRPWNGDNIAGKVDLFTGSCLATSCVDACFRVVSGVNLASHFESFKTSFVASCTPDTTVEQSSDSVKSENQQSGGQQSDIEENNDSTNNDEKGNNNNGGDWGFVNMKPSFTLLSLLFGTHLLQSLFNW
jgi:hypothetical protein